MLLAEGARNARRHLPSATLLCLQHFGQIGAVMVSMLLVFERVRARTVLFGNQIGSPKPHIAYKTPESMWFLHSRREKVSPGELRLVNTTVTCGHGYGPI